MPQYWLAGANPDLKESMAHVWVPRGLWIVHCEEETIGPMVDEMEPGDRIALRDKYSQTEMIVRHVGVIQAQLYRPGDRAVFAVDWLPTDLGRVLPFLGTPGRGAGIWRLTKLPANNPRTREIFFL